MQDYTIHSAPYYIQDSHLSTGTKEYLKVLNAGSMPLESLPIQEARNALINIQKSIKVDLTGIEETERYIEEDKYSLKLNIVRPENSNEKLPVFVFIHGGGWVLGDYLTHKRLVRDLVVESGCACVFVNYTLSPEVNYPYAINEIYAAVRWVAENGEELNVDGKKLALVGNSAGGNMACVASMMAVEHCYPDIKVQILMWPVADAGTKYESYDLYGKERFLTVSLMNWLFDQYTTDPEARKNKHLSPLQASVNELKGLPPTFIQVAENDILRDEGEALGCKLDEAGVEVTTIRYNGVIHDWGMLNGFAEIPQTKSLITISAAILRKYIFA